MTMSIRSRLLLWITGGMSVLLILFALVVYVAISRSLLRGFDEVLLASARTIRGAVELDENARVKFDLDERDAPEFYRAVRPDYFQFWQANGEVLARSPSLGKTDLKRFERSVDAPESPLFRPVLLPGSRAGRAVEILFTPKADEEAQAVIPSPQITLVVARETASLDSTVTLIRWLLGVVTVSALALTLLAGAVFVRQGLRPLDALAAHIATIRHEDLSAQIPADRMPGELVPVVRRLNELLHRLDDAFRRERAFTADAAHELRTPLAGMRCTLEVAVSQPRTGNAYREAITECLEITQRMQDVIEALLSLARYESAPTGFRLEVVNVADLIQTAWSPLANKAAARGIVFEARLSSNLFCTADRDTIQLILEALLANAAEYTNDYGRIVIDGRNVDAVVELIFANTGCALSEADAQHVFDRFWRGDPSRADTGIHCGLGLALVRRAVEALGGSVSAHIADGMFTVQIRLPSSKSLT
jgi:two-component system, OmpR family, heavy metal sensor histidine kinase CusS